jgi:acyl-CoA reductase-like NAD-dependent aldehyde dehydrogenase
MERFLHRIGSEDMAPATGVPAHVQPGHDRPVVRDRPRTEEDVDHAVAAAFGAFEVWWRTPPSERVGMVWRLADVISEQLHRRPPWIRVLAPCNRLQNRVLE